MNPSLPIELAHFSIGPGRPLACLVGPCVLEDEEHAFFCAQELQQIFRNTSLSLIFKGSYDKANRSSLHSFRGPGLKEGLKILTRIRTELHLPVVTDVHTPEEAAAAGACCDMIQIPAFLCRQTDLLVAAAQTGAAINVKKGQFLSPWEMGNVVEKLSASGAQRILLTDRGTCFGYNNLVSDFRSIAIMKEFGHPVCFDATHSVQLPGSLGTQSGGERRFIPLLAKASLAAGCHALFLECHPHPERAKSDGATVLSFDLLRKLLPQLETLYHTVQCFEEL